VPTYFFTKKRNNKRKCLFFSFFFTYLLTRHVSDPRYLLLEFPLSRGKATHDDKRSLVGDERLQNCSCCSSEEESTDNSHHFVGALLPVLFREEACFGVTRFEDGLDVVGADGGEGREDAWQL